MSEPIKRVVRYLGPLEAGTTIEAAGDHLDVTIRTEHFTPRTSLDLETAERIRNALSEVIDEMKGEDDV